MKFQEVTKVSALQDFNIFISQEDIRMKKKLGILAVVLVAVTVTALVVKGKSGGIDDED